MFVNRNAEKVAVAPATRTRNLWIWEWVLKNNRAQLKTKRHTKLTYPVTDLIPFLKNQWLKRQNQNQHERSQGEHQAGACWFSSNGQTTATTQTNPGRQLAAGICIPDSMADPWVKVSRLSGLPSLKQQTFLLGERKWFYVFFAFQSSSSPLLCVFNWILFLWGIFNTTKNGFRYRCSKKCVCRISFCNYREK